MDQKKRNFRLFILRYNISYIRYLLVSIFVSAFLFSNTFYSMRVVMHFGDYRFF